MRNRLEYLLFTMTAFLIRLLPRNAAIKTGAWLGKTARNFQPRRVHIAKENLRAAFAEMADEDISQTVDDMFSCLGQNFVEMLRLDKYRNEEDLRRFFHITGQDHVSQALSLNRGCIILTGHIGFWEAGTFFLPQLGFKTGVVAKPMRNSLVDDYFSRMRTSAGSYIISSRKGARGILKSLHQNHCICILLDQHIAGQGSFSVPFFGRPAHTTTIITQMAIRYQVPIIPAFVYRQPDNSYSCQFTEHFILSGNLSEENISHNTSLLNKKIEEGIRREIGQWFWLHRRWRECCLK